MFFLTVVDFRPFGIIDKLAEKFLCLKIVHLAVQYSVDSEPSY
jgi:hypothetical protein